MSSKKGASPGAQPPPPGKAATLTPGAGVAVGVGAAPARSVSVGATPTATTNPVQHTSSSSASSASAAGLTKVSKEAAVANKSGGGFKAVAPLPASSGVAAGAAGAAKGKEAVAAADAVLAAAFQQGGSRPGSIAIGGGALPPAGKPASMPSTASSAHAPGGPTPMSTSSSGPVGGAAAAAAHLHGGAGGAAASSGPSKVHAAGPQSQPELLQAQQSFQPMEDHGSKPMLQSAAPAPVDHKALSAAANRKLEHLLANPPPQESLQPYWSEESSYPRPPLPLKTNLDRLHELCKEFALLHGGQQGPVFPEGPRNNIFNDGFKPEEIEGFANDSFVILAKPVLRLIDGFLQAKREHGVPLEKKIYAGMTPVQFVDRLIKKRPLCFLGVEDAYLLRTGETSCGGFDSVQTNAESDPINLNDYISYDEMQVSALLGVSVHTNFINTGSRHNRGRPGQSGEYEPSGIYVGLVGARFEREELMEWQHMIITPTQNTGAKGYGKTRKPSAKEALLRAWAEFYGMPKDQNGHYFLSHDEVLALAPEERAKELIFPISDGGSDFFHGLVYRRRLRAVLEPFLRDANFRAEQAKKSGFVVLVGLGLGVWQLSESQAHLFTDEVAQILQDVPLPAVSDVSFSWFRVTKCGGVESGKQFTATKSGNPITIHFNQSDPAVKLPATKLLCACYAWDSNSFPGNEYWFGSLTASGDPAAACCSTIPFLQNPYINEAIAGRHAVVYGEAREPLAAKM